MQQTNNLLIKVFPFKEARNEVKNSSFAQRSAHREVKNMATGIDRTGRRAQAQRCRDKHVDLGHDQWSNQAKLITKSSDIMHDWLENHAQKMPQGTPAGKSQLILDEACSLSAEEIAVVSRGNPELCQA